MSRTESRRRVDGDLSRECAYRLLSHACRRALVDCLDGREGGLALADAAAEVERRNGDRPIHELPFESVERVYTSLYHSHVPQLVEQGALEFDRERNVVTLTERGEGLAHLREWMADVGADGVASTWS